MGCEPQDNGDSKLAELAKQFSTLHNQFETLRIFVGTLKSTPCDDGPALEKVRELILQPLSTAYEAKKNAITTLSADMLCGCYPDNKTDVMFPLDGLEGILEELLEATFWQATAQCLEPFSEEEAEDNGAVEETNEEGSSLHSLLAGRISRPPHCYWQNYLCATTEMVDRVAGMHVWQIDEPVVNGKHRPTRKNTHTETIPGEHRTNPMSKKALADLFGGDVTPKKINAMIKSGSLHVEEQSRQSFIFDRRDLPPEVIAKLSKGF